MLQKLQKVHTACSHAADRPCMTICQIAELTNKRSQAWTGKFHQWSFSHPAYDGDMQRYSSIQAGANTGANWARVRLVLFSGKKTLSYPYKRAFIHFHRNICKYTYTHI